MATFKCKMCGGSLEIAEGMTVCECEYCGTQQTLPKNHDDVLTNLFNRANNLRMKSEFDKAQEIYEKIVGNNPTESEAYWGIVLCKYGIEYVEDPATLAKVPTCHRTQLESVMTDVDYQSALENADTTQRAVYEREAAAIDRLQKDILAIVHKEQPFDVFICYKETDENGRRTNDSVIANDIYHQLTQEGFKVFYAAITLEDKLGQEYEPYIFAALNSAKVMLAIGTKPEYFGAVWVKNEWSRYIKLMKNDRSKLLIPCYKDMDAYDLPEEFSHLQAQDMSKIGFINDLIRGIKKVIVKDEPKPAAAVQTVVQAANTNTTPLLKRAALFLEDGDWASANEYCNKVLDQDPECAQAYFYMLLAELKLTSESVLEKSAFEDGISGSKNYNNALRFADDEMKARLTEIDKQTIYNYANKLLQEAKKRNDCEIAKAVFAKNEDFKDTKEKMALCDEWANELEYKSALFKLENAHDSEDCKNAEKLFSAIKEYKDSEEKIQECKDKAKEIINDGLYNDAVKTLNNHHNSIISLEGAKRQFQQLNGWRDSEEMIKECDKTINRIKAENEAKEKKQKTKQCIISSCCIIAVLAIVGTISGIQIKNSSDYKAAVSLLESGSYDEAADAFSAIKGYKDSADMINECKYQKAEKMMNKEEYDEAVSIYLDLGDYRDCTELTKAANYQNAVKKMDEGKYDEAASIYKNLGDYKDCTELTKAANYQNARKKMDEGKYDEAASIYFDLGDYKDCSDLFEKASLKAENIDLVTFGKYDWFVISKTDSTITLLCKDIVCKKEYNYRFTDVTWSNCSLRKWLNSDFYNEFTNDEKSMIVETNCENKDNINYGTKGGNNTKDKVFLLSADEAREIKLKILAAATDWWLRSPGVDQYAAEIVYSSGVIKGGGLKVDYSYGVRPALTIKQE